jgi:hypothetical protein
MNCRLTNLRWGTRCENRADRVQHGTECSGEHCHFHKLTAVNVQTIRKLIGKISNKQIAAQFGVSAPVISNIKHKRTWAYLPEVA